MNSYEKMYNLLTEAGIKKLKRRGEIVSEPKPTETPWKPGEEHEDVPKTAWAAHKLRSQRKRAEASLQGTKAGPYSGDDISAMSDSSPEEVRKKLAMKGVNPRTFAHAQHLARRGKKKGK